MTTRVTDLFLEGTHAARPAAAAVAVGALYACSDHGLIYKNDGAAWNNWATLVSSPGTPGDAGRGVTSIARTSGTGAAGTTDTYTITYSDATTSTFDVVNGANGAVGGANTLLLALGGTVPGGTAVGTIVFEKSA